LPCPNTSTHKVVSVHVGEAVDSDSLEVVDLNAQKIAGVVKRYFGQIVERWGFCGLYYKIILMIVSDDRK
jgi:hypothetical protein